MMKLSLKDFMKQNKFKDDTMKESELQRVFYYPIYPKDSKTYSDKGFVSIDDGSQGGTSRCCFIKKAIKSFNFDSFGCQTDKFLLNELPKPIIYLIYRNRNIVSKLCRSYCLYFFYLIERVNYIVVFLKVHFG